MNSSVFSEFFLVLFVFNFRNTRRGLSLVPFMLLIKVMLKNGTFVGGTFSINYRKGNDQINRNMLKMVVDMAENCPKSGTFFAVGDTPADFEKIVGDFPINRIVDPTGLIINSKINEQVGYGSGGSLP